MTSYGDIWVNIGSGNVLLPEDNKPFPETVQTLKLVFTFKIAVTSPGGPMG